MKHTWKRVGRETLHDTRIFRLYKDQFEHHGRPVHPYYVLDAPTWVNVVATTAANEVVLVRQYRHGADDVSLEIPGGVVDRGEDPVVAAARELLEETGYAGPMEPLLSVTSNPAILTNRTHSFLVAEACRVAEPRPDPDEELEVVLVPAAEIPRLLGAGEIHHALSVAALGWWLWSRDT